MKKDRNRQIILAIALAAGIIAELNFKLCTVQAAFSRNTWNIELTLFLLSFLRYKGRRSENKAQLINLRELRPQFLKGINREASRRNGQFAALFDFDGQIVF